MKLEIRQAQTLFGVVALFFIGHTLRIFLNLHEISVKPWQINDLIGDERNRGCVSILPFWNHVRLHYSKYKKVIIKDVYLLTTRRQFVNVIDLYYFRFFKVFQDFCVQFHIQVIWWFTACLALHSAGYFVTKWSAKNKIPLSWSRSPQMIVLLIHLQEKTLCMSLLYKVNITLPFRI